MQREQEEEMRNKRKAAKIEQASEDLLNAQRAMMMFDSQPVKSKKQLKQEEEAFPSLDEELDRQDQPKAEGGRKGKRKGGNKAQGGQTLKLGFF